MPDRIVAFGSTHVGRVRATNQDAYSIDEIDERSLIAVVADGMGGHKGGEVAAELAVHTICEAFVSLPINPDHLRERLDRAILAADDIIRVRGMAEPEELFGMGTTCVVSVAVGSSICWAHVGDSRIYLQGQNPPRLEQLTRDHSRVQELIDSGTITAEAARVHPERNVITQALGATVPVVVEHAKALFELGPQERILLCSDGLSGMITDAEIHELLADQSDHQKAVRTLIRAALDAGGTDNITALILGWSGL